MRCEFLLILFCLVSPLKVLKRLRNGGRRKRRKEERGKESFAPSAGEREREKGRERMAMSHATYLNLTLPLLNAAATTFK